MDHRARVDQKDTLGQFDRPPGPRGRLAIARRASRRKPGHGHRRTLGLAEALIKDHRQVKPDPQTEITPPMQNVLPE
jgi:hypothetical protein